MERSSAHPRRWLITIGLLVFVQFAVPDLDELEISGIKIEDFARPRLVLAMVVLFSLVALLQGLYVSLARARMEREPVAVIVDPLRKRLVHGATSTPITTDALQLGLLASVLRAVADLLVWLLSASFVAALIAAVTHQLAITFTPVLDRARAGERDMQAVVTLAGGLLLTAALRLVSCLVLLLAPHRDRRASLLRLRHIIARFRYPRYRRTLIETAAVWLQHADGVFTDPARKAAFDAAFAEEYLHLRIFGSGWLWKDASSPPSAEDWTNLQKRTVVRLLAQYAVEWLALRDTRGMRPFAVLIPTDAPVQADAFCLSMVTTARVERAPANGSFLNLPRPFPSLFAGNFGVPEPTDFEDLEDDKPSP
jgi:hypothetical protein